MSREAWGDEGIVSTHWEETAICEEFAEIRHHLLTWARVHRQDFPHNDFQTMVSKMINFADLISEEMKGKL